MGSEGARDLNKEGRLLLTEVNILQDVLVSDEHGSWL
jgi:hypothetical protein